MGGGECTYCLLLLFFKEKTSLSEYNPRNPTKAKVMTTSELACPLLKNKCIDFIFDGYIELYILIY